MTSILPENAGRQLLPTLVEEIAQSDPDRVLYSVAKARDPADGFRDITAKEFSRAVDRCSWYIEHNLGKPLKNFPTLAYMGPQDVVYAILVLASVKTGYKVLFTSLRNTLDANLSLFEEADCHVYLRAENFPFPMVSQVLSARPMRVLELPGLAYWLGDDDDRLNSPYPYNKTFEEAKSDPFVVLHTSGSTSLPKLVIQTHGTIAPLDAFTALPSLGHQETFPAMCRGTRVYLPVPVFHSAGFSLFLPGCIYSGFTAILGPFPPSADIVNGIHVHGNPQHTVLAPWTLVDLAKDPTYLENLGRLKQITFGGGFLPQDVGDRLSSRTRLLNCFGTTETGVFPIQVCDREDWAYIKVSPVLGHEYRPVSDDLYEQVIIRDPKLEIYQGIFSTYPELDEWPTKDVFQKHPSKDNIWLYKGRVDDLIVFSTAEKLNPYEMESVIETCPAVGAALVMGFGRPQSSLLIEPSSAPPESSTGEAELLDTIWPVVQEANKKSPSYGRIHKNMIMFTSATKPMQKTGKGTVQRKMTLDSYSAEIDALYERNEGDSDSIPHDITEDLSDIPRKVRTIVATSTDINVGELAPNMDLFERGLDSLQVVIILKKLNRLISALGKTQTLEARTIYYNPTVEALIQVTSDIAEGKTPTQGSVTGEQKMQSLYSVYAQDLPRPARSIHKTPSDTLVVLLTGASGSLGAYVLESLLKSPRVSKIYCPIRGQDSLERLNNLRANLTFGPLPKEVQCFEADLAEPYFGLEPQELYATLQEEVTTIVHMAWHVDFNLSLDSFRSQIGAVRRLIDLSAHSARNANVFFTSSVGAVSNWHAVNGQPGTAPIPEGVCEDWRTPQAIGYAQAKFVAERLLDQAAREAGIAATICRVGQIAGPTTAAGVWPKKEWFPRLIASSKYLRQLPSSLGQAETITWVPVDLLARVIVEMVTAQPDLANGPTGAKVYHAMNPRHTTWAQLLPTVRRIIDPTGGDGDCAI
ncbi:putative secondary metabolism biosynthetic enzyme [Neopestalotiopsis sp. 37M]|nr:putative secondary metabolism biosynthetic enzyme [Neopestalotiopsis sp. 37M]